MKTKLLFLTIFSTCVGFSQSIENFTSSPNTNFNLLSPPSSIDQVAAGENATWTFSSLTNSGSTIDTYAAPTSLETSTYPGTTEVLSITTQGNVPSVNKILLLKNGANVSITGLDQGELVLNYTTNAFIGTFPLSYNANTTNPVSGTFSYSNGVSAFGTFSGTITSHVDAFGSLNFNDYSQNVTRLRIDQTFDLYLSPTINIASFTQTNYYYYNNSTNNIDCRHTKSTLISQGLGINKTTETLEFKTSNLSTNDHFLASTIDIYPNPTNDVINIKMQNNEAIKTLKILDNQGREVLVNNKNNSLINTNNLQSGLYFLSIETASGKLANKKFIKQ